MNVQDILERVYISLENDNEEIDERIAELKEALKATGEKYVTVDTERLVQKNRQGRKLMQSYFKKRGVVVNFSKD